MNAIGSETSKLLQAAARFLLDGPAHYLREQLRDSPHRRCPGYFYVPINRHRWQTHLSGRSNTSLKTPAVDVQLLLLL